jgi:hypothetical protein
LQPSKIAFVTKKVGDAALASEDGEAEFQVPYTKVLSLQSDKKDGDWRVSMKVSILKSNGKEDKKDFDFFMIRSGAEMPQGTVCGECERESRFITDLVKSMKKDRVLPQEKNQ